MQDWLARRKAARRALGVDPGAVLGSE